MNSSAPPSAGRLALLLLAAALLPVVVNLCWIAVRPTSGAAATTGTFWGLVLLDLALAAGVARLARRRAVAAVCAAVALVTGAGSAMLFLLAAMAP